MLRLILIWLAGLTAASPALAQDLACETLPGPNATHSVCRIPAGSEGLRLFLNDAEGAPFRSFRALERALADDRLALAFAMNGGMYHRDLSPVGLYVEGGETIAGAVTGGGPGNFHMLPNGIFWLKDGRAGVTETKRFLAEGLTPDYATQSGPMLLIDGEVHPRFIPGSDSRKIRNGVCVHDNGTVTLAISENRVNFHDFALFFRDILGCDDALYLDGTISSLHAPALGRSDGWFPMGPIIGLAVPR